MSSTSTRPAPHAGLAAATLLTTIALLAGCGGDESRTAPVTGVVTLDGAPVADATISFMPQGGGRPAVGVTDESGAYQLTTFEQADGAVPGAHRVSITAVDVAPTATTPNLDEGMGSLGEVMQRRPPRETWRIPQRYSEPDTSGLQFEVKQSDNTADFALQTKP